MVNKLSWKLLIVSVAFLTGCSESKLSENEYIEQAKISIKHNEVRAAIIHLKNAIQINPENSSTRKLLAEQYISMGSAKSAEKEINKARSLGAKNSEVFLLHGKSLLMQGKFEDVIKAANDVQPESNFDKCIVHTLVGHSYLGLGDINKARENFKSASKYNINVAYLDIGMSRLSAFDGNIERAIQHLDKVDITDREFVNAQILKGNLELSRSNYKQSIAIFNGVLKERPGSYISLPVFNASIGLIRAYMYAGKIDAAEKNIDILLKNSPNNPISNYLKATVKFTNADYDSALSFLRQVHKYAADYPPGIFLMGAVLYTLNSYEEANVHLSRFINIAPTHLPARKLLAMTRLKLNRAGEAVDLLKSVADKSDGDDELLAMVARAATAAGNYDAGLKYINRMKEKNIDSNVIQQKLANLHYQKGAYDEAIKELQKITGIKRNQAKLSQVYLYLRKKDIKKAIEIAKSLAETEKTPEMYVLLGRVYVFSGEREKAISNFNKVLGLDEENVHAKLGLAQIYYEDSQFSDAKIQLEGVLSIDSKNIKAMFGMAQITEKTIGKTQAMKWIREIIKNYKRNVRSRIILARYYLSMGDNDKALEIAKEAAANTENSVLSSRFLASVYVARDEIQKAINIFELLTKKEQKNPDLFVELAVFYAKEKRFTDARRILIKAKNINSEYIKPRVALVLLEKESGDIKEALRLSRVMQSNHPKLHTGYVLAGDLLLKQNDISGAIKEYNRGLKLSRHWQLFDKSSNAYIKSGKNKDAISMLEEGMAKFPNKIVLKLKAASLNMSMGNSEKAKLYYSKVVEQDSNNVVALNNLANIENDKKKALDYSSIAYSLVPKNPAVADTHAWLLIETGSISDGLEILEKVVGLSKNPTIKYHYAVALFKADKKNAAKKALSEIKSVKFPEQQEAIKLLESL